MSTFTGQAGPRTPQNNDWNRTQRGIERIVDHVVDGKYQGHPIMGKDTPIDGFASIGGHSREAILACFVDPRIQRVYCRLKEQGTHDYVRTVYEIVCRTMAHDLERLNCLVRKATKGKPDVPLPLGLFVENGVGVCSHMAIFSSLLIEGLIHDEIIRGRVSVDRNVFWGAHAWCRYTGEDDGVIIVDPALQYFGGLSGCRWNYSRPD